MPSQITAHAHRHACEAQPWHRARTTPRALSPLSAPACPSLPHDFAHDLHFRLAARAARGGEVFGDESLPLLEVLGVLEVIPLLQDGPLLVDGAERPRAGRLTGKPVSLPFVVLEIELRVAMPHDEHGAGR